MEEVLYRINAILDQVLGICDILHHTGFRLSSRVLVGDAGVITLVDPAIPDVVSTAPAVNLNSISETHRLVILVILEGSAYPSYLAVGHDETFVGSASYSMGADMTDVNIVNRDIVYRPEAMAIHIKLYV